MFDLISRKRKDPQSACPGSISSLSFLSEGMFLSYSVLFLPPSLSISLTVACVDGEEGEGRARRTLPMAGDLTVDLAPRISSGWIRFPVCPPQTKSRGQDSEIFHIKAHIYCPCLSLARALAQTSSLRCCTQTRTEVIRAREANEAVV